MLDRRVINNKWRRITKRRLHEVDFDERNSFNKWLATTRSSKHSQQEDLPSSQIPSKVSLLKADMAQLFVVIDTCSIVSYRTQLIDFVVRLKELFPKNKSPIRFIISLVVLEELDKCNRKRARVADDGRNQNSGQIQHIHMHSSSNNNNNNNNNSTFSYNNVNIFNSTTNTSDIKHGRQKMEDFQDSDLVAIMSKQGNQSASGGKYSEPPRMFMRFVEGEMRTSEILISELDPFKKSELGECGQRLEIINKDDRILECCLRSQSFIRSHFSHPETMVLLVTEDNVFKSKATTYDVVSYRWCEFETKYKNFGLRNYVSTPMVINNSNRSQGLGGGGGSGGGGYRPQVAHVDTYRDLLEDTDKVITEARIKLDAVRKVEGSKMLGKIPGSPPTPPLNDDDIEIVKEIIILK